MQATQARRRRGPIAEINLVPFIDVMLVLLVIFMITTPLLTQGVKVDLPQTTTKTLPPPSKEPLIISVDAAGQFYLNIAAKPNEPISARVLSSLVASQLGNSSNGEDSRPVLVRGDKNTNYGKIVEAMVLLQQAGAKSVGLITEPETQMPRNR